MMPGPVACSIPMPGSEACSFLIVAGPFTDAVCQAAIRSRENARRGNHARLWPVSIELSCR